MGSKEGSRVAIFLRCLGNAKRRAEEEEEEREKGRKRGERETKKSNETGSGAKVEKTRSLKVGMKKKEASQEEEGKTGELEYILSTVEDSMYPCLTVSLFCR